MMEEGATCEEGIIEGGEGKGDGGSGWREGGAVGGTGWRVDGDQYVGR